MIRAAVIFVGALMALACRGEGTPDDTLVLLNGQTVARLDPRYAATSWEQRISQLIAPGLTGLRDRGLGPTPGLAESLERVDDLTWVARLRADARFSDGRPVTSDDVKYTFDTLLDPRLGSSFHKTWLEYLTAVEVVDARVVRFRLRAPRAPFATDLEGAGIVARHAIEPIDRAVLAAARDKRRPPPLDLAREVVGAGPYRLMERSADVVVLERNPHAAMQPATPRLVVRTIRDDHARLLALVGGSADLILNDTTPQVVPALAANPKLKVDPGPSATLSYLGFNLDDPILQDVRVRQAIALAIDRDRLVAAKYQGRALVAHSPLDRANAYFAPGVRRWGYDPAAARALLDAAGFRDPDGAGPRPRLALTWKTSSLRFRLALAQAMARQLGEIGIAVDVRPFEFATFLDDVKKGNAQLFSLQMTDIVEPDMLRAIFHPGRIPTAENRWTGANRFRYRRQDVGAKLDEASRVSDPERRRALYAEVQLALMEDLPMLPLWHDHNVVVRRREVQGVEVLKTGRLEGLMAAVKRED